MHDLFAGKLFCCAGFVYNRKAEAMQRENGKKPVLRVVKREWGMGGNGN
jgi:hypothetical protein